MRVKVLFFGQLKDILGHAEEVLEAPAGSTLESVFTTYASAYSRLGALRPGIVFARNQQFTHPATVLTDGDEIAFLPPVSGGSGPVTSSRYTHKIRDKQGNFFGLTRVAIDLDSIRETLVAGTDGAVVVFDGVVRNNTGGRPTLYLDYEGYEPMAITTMAQLGREIVSSFDITRIAMVHRLGRLEIGVTSVTIVVTAPHRKSAFAAALEGINRLKTIVPIWKKEHFADGEVWVEGEWDDSVLAR